MDVDEFSDDGFDDLPDNALQELERNAIQLTQVQTKRPPSQDASPQRLSSYGWEEEEDDLDTTEVTNDLGAPIGRPMVDNTLRQQQPRRQHQTGVTGYQLPRRPVPPLPNPRWNPTIGSSKLDGPNIGLHSRRPSVGPPGPAFAASQVFQPTAQASQFPRPPLPTNQPHGSQASQPAPAGDVLAALQRRVRVLQSELHSARGEASILRTKSIKAQQEYDNQISRLKKLTAEQLDRQARIVEAAVAAKKHASTELEFLQRDMRELHDKSRRKDASGGSITTPKKPSKFRGIADGFDEMDIATSPSKGPGRAKSSGSVAAHVGERTPRKGKRKRPVTGSPIAALETSTEDVIMHDGEKHDFASTALPVPVRTPTAPFEFLQLVLDHGAFRQQPPTFEILSRFTFPSEPGRTFSSMVFEKLPLMGNPHRPMQLLVDFGGLVISLWARCVEEEFWEPIKYLVALLSFTIDLHKTSLASLIMPSFVPIASTTILTVADARQLSDGNLTRNTECTYLEEHVDVAQLLSLMYISAISCSMAPLEPENDDSGHTLMEFWSLVSLEIVVLLLTPKQKPCDVIAMLELLTTSVLPTSIGPVSANTAASEVAEAIIKIVSGKLTEQTRNLMAPEQKRSVQLTALRTLIAFSTCPFGALQLASHDNALPRLVACLNAAIDELYDQPIPSNVLPPLPEPLASVLSVPETTASADLHLIISHSVLLIHKLVTDPSTANVVDLSQKLSMSYGGSQRYLISLGRLAFAEEDLIIEAGIEGEVVEAAHELLEMAVTPDEAETINEAFGA